MVHGHSRLRVSEATLLILLYSAGASHGHFVRYKSIMYSEMGCTASLGPRYNITVLFSKLQSSSCRGPTLELLVPRILCSHMPTRFKYMDGQAAL